MQKAVTLKDGPLKGKVVLYIGGHHIKIDFTSKEGMVQHHYYSPDGTFMFSRKGKHCNDPIAIMNAKES